jgi:wyosine [tRNA(Phe)-imidazoG37] synthetase (radical SAM superfamily)
LGRTIPLTNQRRAYIPTADILLEARQALKSRTHRAIDWVTFVGSGEPTLHSELGWLIRQIKVLTDKPIAVITNGSLLHIPDVRRELLAADAVLPTIDAGTVELYRKINRPHSQATFTRLVAGLAAFRAEYRGKLWVEVMLVRGLNDTTKALEDIAKVLQKIKPDAVHISLPTRPPAETWVQPPDQAGLSRAVSILGNIAEVVHPAEGVFDLDGCQDVVDAIIGIITRHPMLQDELERTLERWSPGQVKEALKDLEASGKAQVVNRNGVNFWSAALSRYPANAQSQRTIPGSRQKQGKANQNKKSKVILEQINERSKLVEIIENDNS